MAKVELKTAPADFRFPTTNQTRHCFTRYIEFHRCLAEKGEEASECDKFAKYYRSLCPGEWVERWNEQREREWDFPGASLIEHIFIWGMISLRNGGLLNSFVISFFGAMYLVFLEACIKGRFSHAFTINLSY